MCQESGCSGSLERRRPQTDRASGGEHGVPRAEHR